MSAARRAPVARARVPRDARHRLSSLLVHGKGWTPAWDYSHHVVPPITASSAFRLESVERAARGFERFGRGLGRDPIYVYDRLAEPTGAMLEERLAAAEHAEIAVTFGSGMGAISAAILAAARQGDEVVAHPTLYGCTFSLLTRWLPRLGIRPRWADLTQPGALARALNRRTAAVLFETPTNPTLELIDIQAVAREVRAFRGRRDRPAVIVDNTFATPMCQRPLDLGADVVVESLTKNIGGFGTDMGGVVAGPRRIEEPLLFLRKDFGAVLSPRSAWAILAYGLPSLDLRLRQEERSAKLIARALEQDPRVRRVRYPGLASFPQRDLARRQMVSPDGRFSPGTMIYFELGSARAARRFADRLARRSYAVTLAVSLGQVRTLVELPSAMTHSTLTPGARRRGGVNPAGVRLSVGIEPPDEILHDLRDALGAAR